MSKNLFVAGLSYDTTSDGLSAHFQEIGKITSAQVIIDKYTNKSKGFGFVEMSTDEEATQAIEKLNNSTLDGRNIVVKEAKPREDHRGGNGGGGYGGNNYGGGNRNRDYNKNNKRY